MDENENLEKFLYAAIFFVGGIVAGFHTYSVNALVNPPFIAILSAIAVDGLLAYVMHSIRKQFGSRRWASAVGILLFGSSSAACQVIYQKITSGVPLEPWLQFTGTYIIPVASGTGSFVTVALIQLFGDGKKRATAEKLVETVKPSKPLTQPPSPLAIETSQRPSERPLAPIAFSTDNGEAEVVKKRGPGRPPRSQQTVAYASGMTSDPKVLSSTRKS